MQEYKRTEIQAGFPEPDLADHGDYQSCACSEQLYGMRIKESGQNSRDTLGVSHQRIMRSVELFTGAGGLALGIEAAGFRHDTVIERDKYCCHTIRENQSRGFKPVAGWAVLGRRPKL